MLEQTLAGVQQVARSMVPSLLSEQGYTIAWTGRSAYLVEVPHQIQPAQRRRNLSDSRRCTSLDCIGLQQDCIGLQQD